MAIVVSCCVKIQVRMNKDMAFKCSKCSKESEEKETCCETEMEEKAVEGAETSPETEKEEETPAENL